MCRGTRNQDDLRIDMKRTELLKRINKLGCVFVRSGANHDIYMNPTNPKEAAGSTA